jgi:transcriptional regulator of met regulon
MTHRVPWRGSDNGGLGTINAKNFLSSAQHHSVTSQVLPNNNNNNNNKENTLGENYKEAYKALGI